MTLRPWLIVTFVLCSPRLMAEDTLDRAKQELHPPAPRSDSGGSAKPDPPSSYDHGSSFADDDDDWGSELLGGLFVGIVKGIGYGVHACFLWPSEPDALMGVTGFPYQEGWPGRYAPYGRADHPGRFWGGELNAEAGWIEDDLQRYSLGGRVMLSAFMLRSEWSRYVEERDDGSHNTLNVGTIDAELGITVGPYARICLGVGATITHDSIGTEAGPCVVAGLDAFPIRPLVLQGVVTYGKVGDAGTEIVTLRGTLGALWNRYELYGGWQSTSIGSVDLDGPTAGLRVWF